ncbi:MAG: sterol desaturase family protein [Bacteroidota bacterium]|nr:sterol desaturase family protein [Bacteroidota bacterium]
MEKENQPKTIRVFKNPLLEALTRTSPTITLLVYIPLVFFFSWLSYTVQIPLLKSVLLFLMGMFSWTLLEYLLHRFIFHFIRESETVKRLHYIMHGIHHHYPKSTDKLFMPPVPGLSLVGILYLVFNFFMGELVLAFLPGLITGYLIYVFMHYFIHTTRPPKFIKKLWIHHNLHHYKYNNLCFGVSTTLWDRVFRTMPPKK